MDLGTFAFARQRQNELWVAAGSGFDTGIGLVGNRGAEGLRVRSVAEAPDIFYFF